MTPALTPALAVAYVRELSADVRAVVVLDAAGERLAGPAALAAPARAFLTAAGERADVAARVADGLVLGARSASHAIVVASGPLSLTGPTALDARVAVEALSGAVGAIGALGDGDGDGDGPADRRVTEAAEAVLLAVHGAM